MKRDERHELGVDEQRARDAVRGLGTPQADPAFRAQLRARFVAGTLTGAKIVPLPVSPLRRPSFWAALASAAAVLVLAVGLLNRGPDWRVSVAEGKGDVRIDGQPTPLSDPALISSRLARGGHLEMPAGATLELVAPGMLAARFTRVTDVHLPAAPNRWFWRDADVRVKQGDTFYSTGRDFHGAQLHVETAQAEVLVVGTSLAVLSNEDGTCVCVMEGRVRVHGVHEKIAPHFIPAGGRYVFPSDDSEPFGDTILDYSQHALHKMHMSSGSMLHRE